MAEVPPIEVPVTLTPAFASGGVVGAIKNVLFGEEKKVSAIKVFGQSLLSRKLLLAVVGIVGAVVRKDYGAAETIILSYIGVEGAADIVTRVKS